MARLTGQSIAAGVVDFDAVYLDGGIWKLANATNYPGGIYEGDGVVVTDGSDTLDGEILFEVVFAPLVEGADEGYFRAVSTAISSPDDIEIWGRTVDDHVPTAVDELDRAPGRYGSLLETLFVGNVLPADLLESKVRREISEVLKKHPSVRTVTEFGVDTEGDDAEFLYKVITIDGSEIGGSVVSGVSGAVVETVTISGDGSIAISETGRSPGQYGTALETLTIGRTLPDDLAASEITREIRRSLLQHPEISEVGAFEITLTDDAGNINFQVTTASGETFTAGV